MTQTQAIAISTMTSNINVGMDEVVSVFVAKYESGLFAKKDDLSAKIKAIKQEIEQIDRDLVKSVDSTDYDVTVPKLGLLFKMGEVLIHWGETYHHAKNTMMIEIAMFDKSDDYQRAIFTKMENRPIPADVVTKRDEAKSQLAVLTGELMEVMGLIKSVSRKERQIRGKISEMKLAESGKAGLLDNPEMLQLIQIN